MVKQAFKHTFFIEMIIYILLKLALLKKRVFNLSNLVIYKLVLPTRILMYFLRIKVLFFCWPYLILIILKLRCNEALLFIKRIVRIRLLLKYEWSIIGILTLYSLVYSGSLIIYIGSNTYIH